MRLRLAVRLFLVLATTACGGAPGGSHPLTRDVLGVIQSGRPFELRLGPAQSWRDCVPVATLLLPGVFCSGSSLDVAMLGRLAPRVADALRQPDTDALWAAALLDLASGRDDPQRLDRAISRLAEVLARDSSTAAVANHLAVAFTTRAASRGDARDLFSAADFIERAWSLDSLDAAISFNRAVILGYMRADRQAESLWTSRTERDENWRVESADRRAAARARLTRDERRDGWTDAAIASDPQGAREAVLDSLLDMWSGAQAHGDHHAAASVVDQVIRIGAVLAQRHSDSTVASIGRDLGLEAGSSTAGAVRKLVEASRAYARVDWTVARSLATAAAHDLESSGRHALADWARTTIGGAALARGDFDAARQAFTRAAAGARLRGDRALLGRVTWGLGVLHGRSSSMDQAEHAIDSARAVFAGLDERRNVATLDGTLGEIYAFFGRTAESAAAAYRGYSSGAAIRYEDYLSLAQRLADQGQPRASVMLLREASLMAAASGRDKDVPEVAGRLAQGLAATGALDQALATLASARAPAALVGDRDMRARLQAELERSRARIEADRDPALARASLDSSATYFRNIPVEHAGLLLMRSRLSLALRDSAAAATDLASARDAVRALAESPSPFVRRQTEGMLRNVERTLVGLALARGDTAGAFAHTVAVSAVPSSMKPNGTGEVRFVVLPERTIVWLSAGTTRRVAEVRRSQAALGAKVARFVNLVRSGDDQETANTIGRDLHADLLGAHADAMAGLQRIDLVPDDIIHDVPFAVLVNEGGRYLAERLATRIMAAAEPVRANRGNRADGVRLLVGDPAWDRALFPDLEPLRWARGEVAAIDTLYPDAVVLEGTEATKAGFVAALQRASVVHFAGHARVITEQPAASHLVLAANVDGFTQSVLSAAEIRGMSLGHVRLVVLSACGSNGPSRGMVNPLALAFLDAGVEAVLASQWEADDQSTSTFARAMHDGLLSGLAPEEALRSVQGRISISPSERRSFSAAGFALYVRPGQH